jgi:hypothetical protein
METKVRQDQRVQQVVPKEVKDPKDQQEVQEVE